MSKTKKLSKVLALVIMLALVIGILPMAASATTTGWVSVATGEMIAIDWTQSGTTYTGTVVDANTLSSTTYTMPHTFTLWTRGTPTFTYDNTKISITYLYDSDDGQDKAYLVDVTNIPANSSSSLTVAITAGTYTVALPAATAGASGGTCPGYVNGYLPVGQYAVGAMWGSIYSNGTNINGTTTKITGGYVSTGISLGACGGYVQFQFSNPIQNSVSNPYGVDFIVYGNAFSTNAEAGSVQVSNDGVTWYELAGSRYYRPGTLHNVNVSYKLDADGDNGNRVYYKVWDNSGTNGAEVVYKDWSLLKPGANTSNWWPTYANKKYGEISGVDAIFKGDKKVSKVAWSNSNTEFTHYGITLVVDYDNASEYTFGYADVHGNGTYGTASNPYAAGQNTSGGDGFDISWAVKPDGTPIALTEVKYVRVYTSAGLLYDHSNETGYDPDTDDPHVAPFVNPYIYVHPSFNETSTEVCGVYVASGSTNETALAPTITVGGNTKNTTNGGLTTVKNLGSNPVSVSVSPNSNAIGTSYMFINGTPVTSNDSVNFTPTDSGTIVQIIVQNGEAAPYITWLKLKA